MLIQADQELLKEGKDMTHLAKIAVKCSWFTVDNPQFRPNTIQKAKLLNNGRIELKEKP